MTDATRTGDTGGAGSGHTTQGRLYTPAEPSDGPGRLPTPARPDMPLLGRIARAVLLVEAVPLLALGAAGVVVSASHALTGQPHSYVLWFRLNLAHSLLLLFTALGVFATFRWHTALRRFAWVQGIVYALLFVFGSALSVGRPSRTVWDLNTADHGLHGALFIIAVGALIALNALWLDPPPDAPPYGDKRSPWHGGQPEGR